MIHYLLGELSDADQATVEQRFFSDEEYHERLRQAETDLIDRYGRGELDVRERALFERNFLLTPERRQRARMARALAVVIDEAHATLPVEQKSQGGLSWQTFAEWLRGRGGAWQIVWASFTLMLLIGGIWLWTDARRLRGQMDNLADARQEAERLRDQLSEQRNKSDDLNLQLEEERQKLAASQQSAEQLRKELSRLEQSAANTRAMPALAFLLSPGISRNSGEPTRLAIPDNARRIELELELLAGSERPEYRVEARTAGGNLVWSQQKSGARSNRGTVTVLLPANIFSAGEYELTLRGVTGTGQIEDIGYYYFKVVRR